MRVTLARLCAMAGLCTGLSAPAMAYEYTVKGALAYPGTQVSHYQDGVLEGRSNAAWVRQTFSNHRHDWTLTTVAGNGIVHQAASLLTEKQCMLRARAEMDVAACQQVGGNAVCEDMPLVPTAACSEQ